MANEAGPSLMAALARAIRAGRRPRRPDGAVPADRRWPLLLAAIPLATAGTAAGVALVQNQSNRVAATADAPRLARLDADARARAERPAVAAALAAPTISAVVARLASVLPGDARVHAAAWDGRTLRLEIDCPDPDALRAAIRPDALLGRLRAIGQRRGDADGVRLTLAGAWSVTVRPALAALTLTAIGVALLPPALARLDRARADAARLAARLAPQAAAADPLDGVAALAVTDAAARSALAAILRDAAARQGVLVERNEAVVAGQPGALAVADLVVSGDARHLLRFVEAVETRAPAVRFARWRLSDAGGALRLEGRAAMAWRRAT